jgi:hypothetical protein
VTATPEPPFAAGERVLVYGEYEVTVKECIWDDGLESACSGWIIDVVFDDGEEGTIEFGGGSILWHQTMRKIKSIRDEVKARGADGS